jgi:hypothetical protein
LGRNEIQEIGEQMDITAAVGLVWREAERASKKHPPMHSHHEAYAVIKEEFDEYWQEVQKGGSIPRDVDALKKELTQTAAMCVRTLMDLCP